MHIEKTTTTQIDGKVAGDEEIGAEYWLTNVCKVKYLLKSAGTQKGFPYLFPVPSRLRMCVKTQSSELLRAAEAAKACAKIATEVKHVSPKIS